MTWKKIEDALKFLAKHYPEQNKKPALYHSVRVAVLLWERGFSEEYQIAWLLHDALEDTKITENDIAERFWINIASAVKANSKNKSLDKSMILTDIVRQCFLDSNMAIVVKTFDVYDNFRYYSQIENISEIERCKRIILMMKEYELPNEIHFLQEVFDEILY